MSGRTPRIDAHLHFWRLERGDYGWLTPEMGPIHRDFLPADAAPHLDAAGVDGVVLVQAAPSEDETRFLLSLAAREPRIRGVVGWVALDAPDAPDRLAALAADPRLRAIRPMLQDIGETGWILRPELRPGLEAARELGLAFDALVKPRHLEVLPRLIERHPDLAVVIDHGAKPDIAAGAFDDWAAGMAVLASMPHVHCKLSGLVTEAGPQAGRDDLRRYVDLLLDLFGPERLIWGSDWPVCTLRCDYETWHAWARELTEHAGADAMSDIFGANAVRFYRL